MCMLMRLLYEIYVTYMQIESNNSKYLTNALHCNGVTNILVRKGKTLSKMNLAPTCNEIWNIHNKFVKFVKAPLKNSAFLSRFCT